MRIEKIRIQNLNSLYGTHEVDLTADKYHESNLFMIWGPTGSGKTTILDAITLALYDRTSRLGKMTSSDEIMAKGTKYCSAEVVFSIGDARYRASWSQEYDSNGNPKRSRELCKITESGDAIVMETALSEIDKAIENLVRLNYEQFTKAVLLEQGRFSEFLTAKDDDRAKILEQLTGTEIYSKLSEKAYKRAEAEEKNRDLARKALEGIELLSDDEIEKCKSDKALHETEINAIKSDIDRINAELNWIEKESEAAKRVAAIEAQKLAHEKETAAFEPKRIILLAGERAAKIGHIFDQNEENEKSLKDEQIALDTLQAQLPQAKQTLEQREKEVEESKTNSELARQACEDNKPLFDSVRELQTEIRTKENEVSEFQQKLKRDEQACSDIEKQMDAAKKDVETIESRLANAEIFFEQNAIDEQLLGDYGAIEVQQKQLLDAEMEIHKLETAYEVAQKEEVKDRKALVTANHKLEEARGEHEANQKTATASQTNYEQVLDGHSLIDLESHRDTLLREKSTVQEITDYAKKRLELVDGEACPLCGATNHPFCEGKIPQISEVDKKINGIEAQIKAIRKAKDDMDKAFELARKSQLALNQTDEARKSLQKALDMTIAASTEKGEALETSRANQNAALASFNQMIEKYGESATDCTQLPDVCKKLKLRRDKWKNAVPLREKLKEECKQKKADLQTLQALAEEKRNQSISQKELLAAKTTQLQIKRDKLRDLFGDRDVEAEEKALKARENEAKNQLQKASESLASAKSTLDKLNTGIVERQKNVETWKSKVDESQAALTEALKAQNFNDEADFRAARQPDHDLQSLRQYADTLDKAGNDIKSRAAEAGQVLSKLRQNPLTSRSKQDLQAEKEQKNATIEELNKKLGIIHQKLETQQKDRDRLQKLTDDLRHAEAEYQRWDNLNKLIGQCNGGKFRKFAQSVTFNALLRNANRYLRNKKLMPRYELVRRTSDDQTLSFMVMDYNTGFPRTANNLSGGEKFCMSLALALALSEMASNNVAVESLFIDEGLGTLDDETLDTALAMLQNLGDAKRERLVGLISHIERAQRKITTHITVETLGNGHRRLSGPGCTTLRTVPDEPKPKKKGKKTKIK
ncbi:MAG: AAA family ATPase [Proteobacteria bacterium]|nr:AAA family ATPase [Pseudomonadota bacterium]